MAKTFVDTFTRTAAALGGSTSSDGLFTWSILDGPSVSTNGTSVDVASGHAAFAAGASADCDTDSMYAETDFTISNGSVAIWLDICGSGVYPSGTGYEFACFGGSAYIFAIASNTFTQLATASHSHTSGTYRAERNGSTLTFYRNGVSILTASVASEPTGAGNRKAYFGGDTTGGSYNVAEFRYGDVGGSGTTDGVAASDGLGTALGVADSGGLSLGLVTTFKHRISSHPAPFQPGNPR